MATQKLNLSQVNLADEGTTSFRDWTRAINVISDDPTIKNDFQKIDEFAASVPIVTANPTDTASGGNLKKLKINDIIYKVGDITANPGGTLTNRLTSISIDGASYIVGSVVANPGGTPSNTLNTITIDGTNYKVGGGDPATTAPLMDAATAAVGTHNQYAREDHVHPSDTSRLNFGAARYSPIRRFVSGTTYYKSDYFTSVAYHDNTIVVCYCPTVNQTASCIFYSTDNGVTWETANMSGFYYHNLIYANGYFVVTTGNCCVYSQNGKDWTYQDIGGNKNSGLAFGNGYYVACDGKTTRYTNNLTTNWSNGNSLSFGEATTLTSMAYQNTYFVVTVKGCGLAYTNSPSGTWTTITDQEDDKDWVRIIWGHDRFVALSEHGRLFTSTNPTQTWSNIQNDLPTDLNWSCIGYNAGTYYAIAKDTNLMYTSTDLATWKTVVLSSTEKWFNMAFSDTAIYLVALTDSENDPTFQNTGGLIYGLPITGIFTDQDVTESVAALVSPYLKKATNGDFGVVKIGSGLTVVDGVISVSGSTYELPIASASTLGGVKINGNGLSINSSTGVLSNTYALPIASNSQLGGVKIDGNGLSINSTTGVLSNTYTLPIATRSDLGGVMIGDNLVINATTGKLDAQVGLAVFG